MPCSPTQHRSTFVIKPLTNISPFQSLSVEERHPRFAHVIIMECSRREFPNAFVDEKSAMEWILSLFTTTICLRIQTFSSSSPQHSAPVVPVDLPVALPSTFPGHRGKCLISPHCLSCTVQAIPPVFSPLRTESHTRSSTASLNYRTLKFISLHRFGSRRTNTWWMTMGAILYSDNIIRSLYDTQLSQRRCPGEEDASHP